MTSRVPKLVLAGLVPLALAGCGGGGGGGSSADVATIYSDNVSAYNVMSSAVTGTNPGMQPTPDAYIQTASGSATFSGYASLLAGPPSSRIALVSPASITADFDTSKISGSANNFIGQTGNVTANTYLTSPTSYTGQLLLDGCIGASCSSNTNDLTATVTGTLSGDGNTIVVNQAVSGKFYGPNATAVDLNSGSTTNTVNGTAVTSSLDFVGTR